MLSKKMYKVLSCFPESYTKSISYEELLMICKLTKDEIDECLNETLYPNWNYIRSSNGFQKGSMLSLTEDGLAKREEYEDSKREHRIVLVSLIIAIIAMLATVVSAITAFAQ